MTPVSNEQIHAEMIKIGAKTTTIRVGHLRTPGGDAESHCTEFQSCEKGFIWDCEFDSARVCDNEHEGKLTMRLKTHGCNNCEPTGVGPIDYTWWSIPATETNGKPDKGDSKWKKESDMSTITIQPGKDFKVGDALWLKQRAVCNEYKGEKDKTIEKVFKLSMVECDDNNEPIDPKPNKGTCQTK